MKLRAALFLAAAFLATALALSVLPACSDETFDIDCYQECGNDCFLSSKLGDSGTDRCVCIDLIPDPEDETKMICPL